jgi:dephospho-CoA kinase
MYVVGITGSLGTGKTTVAKLFKQLGAKIIDADSIAHSLIKVNSPSYKSLIRSFGKDILKHNSCDIDRNKLARIVFGNKKQLLKLNRILHPVIIKKIKEEIKLVNKRNKRRVIILDAPLLIEAGLLRLVDRLIVVAASRGAQVLRLKKRGGISKKEIEARINFQIPLSEKIKSADFVIDNNGSLTYTKKQMREIWEDLRGQMKPRLTEKSERKSVG